MRVLGGWSAIEKLGKNFQVSCLVSRPREFRPEPLRRTVRKPLDLHGSHYPTLFPTTLQWKNNWGVAFFSPAEPAHTALLVTRQGLVLASGPLHKLLDRCVERAHASPSDRMPRSSSTTLGSWDCIAAPVRRVFPASVDVCATPDLCPHPLQGIGAHPRQEIGKCLLLTVDGLPRPKRESEEREVHMRIGCGSVAVLAVHDLRFLRMHRQPTFRQPQCDGPHYLFRLLLSAAVNYRIIGIAGKRTVWIGTLHPGIERVMHEQVHQNRADHPALRRTALAAAVARRLWSRTGQLATVRCTAVSSPL